MTTFQEPPLQSRRAARQGERPESSATPFSPPQVPRTAAGAGEPLSYVTQNRPPLPGYDGAPAAPHGRRSSEPSPAAPADSQQTFRPRDFSPEARSAPPAWAPADDRESGVVDHYTQARANVVPPAGSLAEALSSEPSEQTLSRRELRALRDAHGITAATTDPNPIVPEPAPAAWVPQPAPAQQAPAQPAPQQAPAPAASTQLDSAMAEFDALAGRPAGPESRPPATAPRRSGRRASVESAPDEGLGQFDAAFAPAPAAPVAQAPVQQAPVAQAPVQQAPMQQYAEPQPAQYLPPQDPQSAAPTTGERPIGHWTTQSEIDDRVQVNESTISRTIGSGVLTTSALVLPSLPGHDMATGEVMLTDSINLPSALAATGAHTPLDESDIDHLLDPGDHQLVNTDSVPIRAIRAVSSHTASRSLINSHKPARANRALTVLIASASVMVVVVVTLLVVAMATGVL
jgi:hypothetical protein